MFRNMLDQMTKYLPWTPKASLCGHFVNAADNTFVVSDQDGIANMTEQVRKI